MPTQGLNLLKWRYLWKLRFSRYIFPYTALTLFGPLFQNGSGNISYSYCSPLPRSARTTVWALTISLAATFAITVVFFSSGYLDVSVHCVFLYLSLTDRSTSHQLVGSPIRTSLDHCSLTAPQSISSLVTADSCQTVANRSDGTNHYFSFQQCSTGNIPEQSRV